VKAILATRCGCQQTYIISYPPPHSIMLPLHERREWAVVSFSSDTSALPRDPVSPLETREFVLVNPKAPLPRPTDIAYYAEV